MPMLFPGETLRFGTYEKVLFQRVKQSDFLFRELKSRFFGSAG
jgi:hypothetical protein